MEHEINILVVEPGKPPRPARVVYSLETFSQLVGGALAMGCFTHKVGVLSRRDFPWDGKHEPPGKLGVPLFFLRFGRVP